MNASKWNSLKVLGVLSITLATTASLRSQDYLSSTQYTSSSNSGFGWQSPSWNGSGWSAPSTGTQWQLGITGTNTDTGVQVGQVSSNSAAARAGIVVGDTIISVGGSQVGRVNGKIFEISEQINRYADSSGRVSILIFDSRSRQLRPMYVQLDRQQAGLSGTIVVNGGTVPANSMVTVMIENVTRPHYSVRNGEQSFSLPAYSTGDIPFSLNFDPSYIFPTDQYRVRAYISSGGRTVFDTAQPQFVLTQGNPTNVRLVLSPVSYTAATSPPNNGYVVAAGYANYDAISQQVNNAYMKYLGRPATSIEQAAWHQLPDVQVRLSKINLELMAAQEYFDLVGNNNLVWLEKVFTDIVGRPPSAAEIDQWMRRFSELRYSRMELLKQLDGQVRR